MSVVHLNVGGNRYSTSTDTLNRYPSSTLAMMLNQESQKNLILNGQEIFMDRNGELFKYILDYLRNGPTDLDLILPSDNITCRKLLKEAEYFHIDELSLAIKEKLGGFENRQTIFTVKTAVKFSPQAENLDGLNNYLDTMSRWNIVDVNFKPMSRNDLENEPCWLCGEPAARKLPDDVYIRNLFYRIGGRCISTAGLWGTIETLTNTCALVKFNYPNYEAAVGLSKDDHGDVLDCAFLDHVLLHVPITFLEKL